MKSRVQRKASRRSLALERLESRQLLTSYFIDAANGSDAYTPQENDAQHPWATYRNIVSYYREDNRPENHVDLQAGDQVIFRPGRYDLIYDYSTHKEALYLRNVHGTPEEPIVLRAWGRVSMRGARVRVLPAIADRLTLAWCSPTAVVVAERERVGRAKHPPCDRGGKASPSGNG